MPAPAQVEYKNVTKQFSRLQGGKAGRLQAILPMDFTITKGEFFTIIGPSGCGKSTLLNLLAGFDTPDSGEVLLDGQPVQEPGPDRAVVFQEAGLMPWMNVRENVEYGLKLQGIPAAERRERALQYVRMVHLSRFVESYPHQLSGGMRQRVSIARAMALEPNILLMDEPFSALDAQTRDVLHEELQRLWEETKTTILFVTHNLSEAVYLSDRILIMTASPGRIKRLVRVPFPHPRHKSSEELAAFVASLHEDIKEEVSLVAAKEHDADWSPLTGGRKDRTTVDVGEGI